MLLLCNRNITEFGKADAYRGPMFAPGNYQWCGEPYFAGVAISIDGLLPQISRRDNLIRALWTVNLMLALNLSLLNKEYNVMNVLKILAAIQFSPRWIFLKP
jgi:hypothetical protein